MPFQHSPGSVPFNLTGVTLRIATLLRNTELWDTEVERTGSFPNYNYSFVGGYGASVFMLLSDYLNFTYVILQDDTDSLPYAFANASEFSIDVFAATFYLTLGRTLVVDPTHITALSRVFAYMNHEFETDSWDLIVATLEKQVWTVLGLGSSIIAAIGVSSWCTSGKELVYDSMFSALGLTLSRNTRLPFRQESQKILLFTGSIISLLTLTTFSSVFIAVLAVKKYSINSLEELVNSHYDINFSNGANNSSSIYQAVLALNQSSYHQHQTIRKLFKKVGQSTYVHDSYVSAFKRVLEQPYANIIDEAQGFGSMEEVMGTFPCHIGLIPFNRLGVQANMYMPKGSKYKKSINFGITKLNEGGLLKRQTKRWISWRKDTECSRSIEDYSTTLRLSHVRSSFVTFFVGSISALAIASVERSISKVWRRGSSASSEMLKTAP